MIRNSHYLSEYWKITEGAFDITLRPFINYWNERTEQRRSTEQVYDNFSLIFKYSDGAHFSYDCNSANKHNGMQFQVQGNEGTMELESNKQFAEDTPPPAIDGLLQNIDSNESKTIPIGGATWVPTGAVTYGSEFISEDWEMNETLLCLEGFLNFIREGKAPEKLTIDGYNASTWSLYAEEAMKKGIEIKRQDKYTL